MFKKICLLAGIFLLTGAGCSYPSPNEANQNNSVNKNDILNKTTSFFTTSSSVFQDPQADFTFVYPASWVRSAVSSTPGYPESHIWEFTYQNHQFMYIYAPSYEPAFDSCLGLPANLAEVSVFNTNDPSTTVREEICGGDSDVSNFKLMSSGEHFINGLPFFHAYIYWLPGIRLTTSSSLPYVAWIKNPHIILINELTSLIGTEEAKSLTKVEYLEILHRIASGIKLKE